MQKCRTTILFSLTRHLQQQSSVSMQFWSIYQTDGSCILVVQQHRLEGVQISRRSSWPHTHSSEMRCFSSLTLPIKKFLTYSGKTSLSSIRNPNYGRTFSTKFVVHIMQKFVET